MERYSGGGEGGMRGEEKEVRGWRGGEEERKGSEGCLKIY